MIDKVKFEVQATQLIYSPTQGARAYQSISGVGIAIVALIFAAIVAKHKPLFGLLEKGEAWNVAAVSAFSLISVSLLLAIYIYWRMASQKEPAKSRSG